MPAVLKRYIFRMNLYIFDINMHIYTQNISKIMKIMLNIQLN